MSKNLQMYGLGHCSTCQKAIAALQDAGYQVDLHDVKTDPLPVAEWEQLLGEFGDKLVNRASLTWRGMSDDDRAAAPAQALAAHPSLIKRPAIVAGDQRLLGWTANVKRALGVPV